jgi:methyl-accepting chemotaxis protein
LLRRRRTNERGLVASPGDESGRDLRAPAEEAPQLATTDRAFADLLAATVEHVERLAGISEACPATGEGLTNEDVVKRCDHALAILEVRLHEQPTSRQLSPEDIDEAVAALTELRETSSEQAAFLKEAGSAADRMESSIVENSRLAQSASEAASELSQRTETGTVEILSVVSRLQTSADHAVESLSTIFDLGNSSNEIARMAKTINEIAEQTKILALNAAIAAARAGEQGREFGVISSEIRQLATRTAETARDITKVIGSLEVKTRDAAEIMQQIDVGLDDVDVAGDSLHAIAAETGLLVGAVDQISTHSKSQSAATSDVLFGIDAAAMTGEQLIEGVRRLDDFVDRLTDTFASKDANGR